VYEYWLSLTKIYKILRRNLAVSMAERLTRVPRVRKVWSSDPGPAKSYTPLQTVYHRFNIYASSYFALTLRRRDGYRKLVTRFGVIRRV